MHNDRQLIDEAAPHSRGSLNHAWGYWGLALLMAALYSILSLITPLYLDDWIFRGNWRDDIAGGHEVFSFSYWWDFFQYTRGYDNGRIANMLDPIFTMFSPWKELFPYINGILVALTAVLLVKLSVPCSKRNSVALLVVAWALMIIGLPWRDTLFVRDYSLNYIWSGAITLFFLYIVRKGEREGWGRGLFALSILLAFLAGGWHEGFAVPTLCGIALLIVIRKFRFSNTFYIIITVYLFSAFLFMLSPGMIGRIKSSLGDSVPLLIYRHFFIIFLPALLIIFNAFSKIGREILVRAFKSDLFITGVGVLISGLFIAVMASRTPRSFYWPDMAAIAITLYLLSGWINRVSKLVKYVVAGVLVVMCSLQVGAAIYWQGLYTRDWEAVMSGFETSETGTVFYDSPNPPHAPRYTLGIPYAEAWRSPWHLSLFQSYVMTPTVGVVPTALRDARLGEATPLRHSPGTPPVSLYKGYLISSYECLDTTSAFISPAFRDVKATMPDGIETSGTYVAVPFVTERGDTLTYYTPW